jgi:hypothetical protein
VVFAVGTPDFGADTLKPMASLFPSGLFNLLKKKISDNIAILQCGVITVKSLLIVRRRRSSADGK